MARSQLQIDDAHNHAVLRVERQHREPELLVEGAHYVVERMREHAAAADFLPAPSADAPVAADGMTEEPRQLGRAAGPPSGEAGRLRRPAAERLSAAKRVPAPPALDGDPDHDRPPLSWQVLKIAAVAPVS